MGKPVVCETCDRLATAVLVSACKRIKRDDCEKLAEKSTVKELAEKVIGFVNELLHLPDTPENSQKREDAVGAMGLLDRFTDIAKRGGTEAGR
tara:strand:- start:13588 stop:13866 length:279 start_codon:yes stop_codon:yes gene_type:complete